MRASSVDSIILETLAHSTDHMTSLQVFEAIRQRLPAVNPSTVYRSLERLALCGKVSVSNMGTGATVYESLANGIHHHLVCQACGGSFTLEHEQAEQFFAAILQTHQFKVLTNHLVLFGLCPTCQAAGADNCPPD